MKEKIIIGSEDICSLEKILGPNDPLFQPEPESEPEPEPEPQENKE